MKNCKTLYEVQTASCLKEIFQPPPTHPSPDKILLCLWNKNFITETYRKMQALTFKVFQVLLEQLVVNVKLVEVSKMREVFWAKLYCKMSDPFR